MRRIPAIEKFRGDNDQSFRIWLAMLEAQMQALGTEYDKKRETLLCCLEKAAFQLATATITADNEMTHDGLTTVMRERFCGSEYKRLLEVKLRNLKFKPGTKINSFIHELKNVIQELYDVTDPVALDLIAQNHILAQVEPVVQDQAKVLQLTGTCKLESILELINTSSASTIRDPPQFASGNYPTSSRLPNETDRVVRSEQKVDALTNKLDLLLSSGKTWNKQLTNPSGIDRSTVVCEHCGKVGHGKDKCFKLKTCFHCKRKGHLSRHCRFASPQDQNDKSPSSGGTSVNGEDESVTLPESSCILLKVVTGGTFVDLLYDPGSTYSMLKHETFNSLRNKPPEIPLNKSGISVSGDTFKIESVAFVNFKFCRDDQTEYLLEYEPVLISSKILSDIFRVHIDMCFKGAMRDHENEMITFIP